VPVSLIISCVIILVLILMSAFFAGSETALTAASKARMHALEKEGDKRAALVGKICARKDRMIGTLLFGNTLVNILSSAIATNVMIKLFGEAGVVYATGLMTLLILIYAEVLPKTYAFHFADTVAMKVAPLVRVIIAAFAPVTTLVGGIVNFTFKMFGADTSVVNMSSHVELLRGAIELHRGPDEGTQEQRAMLRSILDLADVDVSKIMTHRKDVTMIDATLPVDKIIEEVLQSPYTRLPLWKESPDNIIGVIHAKALLKDLQERQGRVSGITLEHLAAEPWFVPDTTSLFDQLQEFRKRREHFALVVDEYGELMGVVTLEDILEEIVGEIEDEMDEIVAGVRKQPGGTYVIDGDVTIRDLNREFEWNLPDEDYATLAGLILNEAQRIPEPGQSFNFFGFRFDIMRRQRNQITLIRVTPPKKKKEEKAA
jgi:Mg2+/Co2+ transporter CorB